MRDGKYSQGEEECQEANSILKPGWEAIVHSLTIRREDQMGREGCFFCVSRKG